jgi:hypothetical protein
LNELLDGASTADADLRYFIKRHLCQSHLKILAHRCF